MNEDSNKGLRQSLAQLDWLAGNTPRASAFDDVYFSREDGLKESRHVFLQHNDLAARWRALPGGTDTQFNVGETGFGCGLNFLLCWRQWRQSAPASARLHYLSIEQFPLGRADMLRALGSWPELTELATQLTRALPPPLYGQHLLLFDHGRVSLLLCYSEVAAALDNLLGSTSTEFLAGSNAKVDAWFLDGFAPQKNPAMWRPEVLGHIAALSRRGTSLSSFTAAGEVRRGLATRGFAISKVPGFASKRDMLKGTFVGRPQTDLALETTVGETPWHWQPGAPDATRKAVVIGAGIAGACTALALARRGWQVTVLERGGSVACRASGNAQSIIHTKLPIGASDHAQFTLSSYLHALHFYRNLQREGHRAAPHIHLDGVLQLHGEAGGGSRLAKLRDIYQELEPWIEFVTAEAAAALANVPVPLPGIWFANAGWVESVPLCSGLLQSPGIELLLDHEVVSLHRAGDSWEIKLRQGRAFSGSTVILANADAARTLTDLDYLRLGSLRGQVSRVACGAALRCVLCSETYMTPALNGLTSIGASYKPGDSALDIRTDEHHDNLAAARRLVPGFAKHVVDVEQLEGRAGLRCTSRDYLPVVGAAPDPSEFRVQYSALRRNARKPILRTGPVQAGLFLNIAHGSRGFSSAPLCAELLAAQIDTQIAPVSRRLQRALHPARFLIRELIRGKAV